LPGDGGAPGTADRALADLIGVDAELLGELRLDLLRLARRDLGVLVKLVELDEVRRVAAADLLGGGCLLAGGLLARGAHLLQRPPGLRDAERVPASELDAEVERPDQEGEDRDEEDRGRDAVPDLAPANDLQVGLAPVEPAREILETVARLPHGSRRPIA